MGINIYICMKKRKRSHWYSATKALPNPLPLCVGAWWARRDKGKRLLYYWSYCTALYYSPHRRHHRKRAWIVFIYRHSVYNRYMDGIHNFTIYIHEYNPRWKLSCSLPYRQSWVVYYVGMTAEKSLRLGIRFHD